MSGAFNDASLKIVSLGLAVLLWFHVTTNVRTVELLVPYEILGLPRNKILVSSYRDKVKVRLSGPSFILKSVQSSYPVFKVEVPAGLQQDSFVAKFSLKDLGLPAAVQVLNIEPKQIELRFDARIWKEVPIEVPRIGVLDPDYSLAALAVEPERVKLEGPGSELREVQQVETFPLQMRDVVQNPVQVLGIRVPSALTDVAVTSVRVQVDLKPIIVTKTFERVSLEVPPRPGAAFQLDPGTVRIRVSGPRKRLRNLTPQEIKVRLQVPEAGGSYELEPSVDVEAGLTLLSVEPAKVKVTVSIEEKKEEQTGSQLDVADLGRNSSAEKGSLTSGNGSEAGS